MVIPRVLTKFTKYYDNSFELKPEKSIKASLPSEFNDVFDTQVHFHEDTKKELSEKYQFSPENIECQINKINNGVHILSFSGNSADSILNTNMWGIYANNGKGLAFEFDYNEICARANGESLELLVKEFVKIDNENPSLNDKKLKKQEYLKTNYGKIAFDYLKSHMNFLNCDNSNIPDNEIELIEYFIINLTPEDYNKLGHNFLHKVVYTTDNSILKNSFEAFLLQEKLPLGVNHHVLNNATLQLYKTKSILWQHEHEYRLITPYYAHRDWLQKSASSSIKDKSENLNEFLDKNNINDKSNKGYFYKFSDEPINQIEDNIDGNGAVELINLPFPKKVYLGWDFFYKSSSETEFALNKIKRFCQEFKVELIQLKKYPDYDNGKFMSSLIGLT